MKRPGTKADAAETLADGRDLLLREVILRAVTSPPSLFLAGLGGLLTISPYAWPAGLAALAAEAGWIWWRVRDSRFASECSQQVQRQRWRALITRLEELSGVLDPTTAAALSSIVEAQERLLALYGAETLIMPHTRTELTSLLQHCLALAEKRHELQTYAASFNEADLLRERTQLQVRLDSTPDTATRALYEQALDQKQQELCNHRQLEAAIGRIDGQLTVVQCTFDNLLSRMIRLHSVEPAPQEAQADPVFQELNQLTTRVAELESSLNETVRVGIG